MNAKPIPFDYPGSQVMRPRPNFPDAASPSQGFSLIEVIVAMAICLLGLAAILQMSNLSQSFARKAADTTELQIICQNRVSEVLAGLVPLESVTERKCPENEAVTYTLRLEPHEQLPLALLEVTVKPLTEKVSVTPTSPQGKSSSPPSSVRRRDQREREVTLRRWIALSNRPSQLGPGNSNSPEMAPPGILPPTPPAVEDEGR